MPAIAPIEDLKAVENALRSMFLAGFPLQLALYDIWSIGNGVELIGRMSISHTWKKGFRSNKKLKSEN